MVRASVNHGTPHVPCWPSTCEVFQMPGAYADAPPIWLTLSCTFSNPPSAAKKGTCVVPACVTSGASPDTAALRIRSSWTSQPTSSTLTLIPVFCSNGATIRWVSATGLGPLFMIHSRTVWPLRLFAGVALALLDVALSPASSLLLPHAATMSDNIIRATATTTVARLLRISAPPAPETDLQKRLRPWWCVVWPHGDRGGT